MGSQFASARNSIAACDRCGQRFKLTKLQFQTVKTKKTALLVCPECLDIDHPQLLLGTFPVYDPQAVRDPRPDTLYTVSGLTSSGTQGGGSRVYQWGWNPVGGGNSSVDGSTPNPLAMRIEIGTVTVVTT